jgi:hypothetical protein
MATSGKAASDGARESDEVLTGARRGVDSVAWWRARQQLRALSVTPCARRSRGGERRRSIPEGTQRGTDGNLRLGPTEEAKAVFDGCACRCALRREKRVSVVVAGAEENDGVVSCCRQRGDDVDGDNDGER